MKGIHAVPSPKGLSIPSEYNRQRLKEWMKQYKSFTITPNNTESVKGRRFLEGAVIPAYCKWQYDIDPTDEQMDEARRYLFKRDFRYEVVESRQGNPVRIPLSSKGKAKELTDTYVEWAEQNGAPIPNTDLYKMWRDEWSMDARFANFYEWLGAVGLECDAMPSNEVYKKLES